MGTTKNELLGGTAPFTEPEPKPRTKGKSKLEVEIERNQAATPKIGPRGARADNAEHDHPPRHGARGGDLRR